MFQPAYDGRRKDTGQLNTDYHFVSLVDLMAGIANRDDRKALNEFQNRRTFRYGGEPLCLVEFLSRLRDNEAKKTNGSNVEQGPISDKAYDLTLDKFSNLPNRVPREAKSDLKPNGSDCRFYFKACLKKIHRVFSKEDIEGEIEREIMAAKLLQNFVRFHWYLSRLEAERHVNRFWTRYFWKIQDVKICLYLPASLGGHNRRKWLEKNIDDPDPFRPGERKRIQAIINQNFPRERFVALCQADLVQNRDTSFNDGPYKAERPFRRSLGAVVAQEKADNIHKQRTAIQSLGPKNLKSLIERIFEDIGFDHYVDSDIARDFGLSKSTFSRFAGSHWQTNETSSIPDLWQNVAGVLSSHPDFRKVAKETGYLNQAEAVVRRGIGI